MHVIYTLILCRIAAMNSNFESRKRFGENIPLPHYSDDTTEGDGEVVDETDLPMFENTVRLC